MNEPMHTEIDGIMIKMHQAIVRDVNAAVEAARDLDLDYEKTMGMALLTVGQILCSFALAHFKYTGEEFGEVMREQHDLARSRAPKETPANRPN